MFPSYTIQARHFPNPLSPSIKALGQNLGTQRRFHNHTAQLCNAATNTVLLIHYPECPLVFPQLPLPVLIQAVDDGISLFNYGDQLLHQHLLPCPVLIRPLFLYSTREQNQVMQPASLGKAAGLLLTSHRRSAFDSHSALSLTCKDLETQQWLDPGSGPLSWKAASEV